MVGNHTAGFRFATSHVVKKNSATLRQNDSFILNHLEVVWPLQLSILRSERLLILWVLV